MNSRRENQSLSRSRVVDRGRSLSRLSRIKASYTCWIGNISLKLSDSDLEYFFKKEGEKFGAINCVKIEYNQQHNKYQCYIHYLKMSSVLRAVDYFDGKRFRDNVLKPKSI